MTSIPNRMWCYLPNDKLPLIDLLFLLKFVKNGDRFWTPNEMRFNNRLFIIITWVANVVCGTREKGLAGKWITT